jgi:anti-sigma factor RsiW
MSRRHRTEVPEPDRRALLRLLHGELPAIEAARLRARLAAEPELAAAHARLAAVWRAAEPPPVAPPPPGFSGRVMARVRAAAREPRWSEAPLWVRAAAAAAALAGVLAGAGLGARLPAPPPAPSREPAVAAAAGFDEDQLAALGLDGGLAGGYWEALGVIDPVAPAADEALDGAAAEPEAGT